MKAIKLTQGKYAIVDDIDFSWLNQWKWYFGNSGYAMRKPWNKGENKAFLMHRVIMNPKNDEQVDHINRNRLDNRRENLRIVTPHQQRFNMSKPKNNTSGYKGVSWSEERKKWVAQIQINGKNVPLGRYIDIAEAINARKEAERRYFIICA